MQLCANQLVPLKPKRRLRRSRRIWVGVVLALVLLFAAMNVIAYLQAKAMTFYVEGVPHRAPSRSMTLWQKVRTLLIGTPAPRPRNSLTPADFAMDYQTVRFGGSTGDDLEGWIVPSDISPSIKPICLLFHGYTSSKSTLLAPATVFHALGYDMILVDLRGSGGSRGNETTCGYREADDVVAAIKFSAARWPGRRVILYGQSMGAAAAFRATGVLGARPVAIIAESCFDRMISTTQNCLNAVGLPVFPMAYLLLYWGSREHGFDTFRFNPVDDVRHVYCPVLILQGANDPGVTMQQARSLCDHLGGKKSFEVFPDSSHCTFYNDDPAHWTQAVSRFLAGVDAAPSF